MALATKPVAGTASILLRMIFRARSHECVPPARSSATTRGKPQLTGWNMDRRMAGDRGDARTGLRSRDRDVGT